ncbi:hypothetical protein A176_005376 [Myxococcus hansupus]|uniref:Uncharacterized protein n=1 Tax=Pseudomyxococcus hansupus TaxID=1297742 RepID=A0A0H4X049_9BACT|nr:hypothetical protein [Myxococcus hansupus]AKQ68464.1 hypothetical protein A176_005376 [Myxococcus hansupus]
MPAPFIRLLALLSLLSGGLAFAEPWKKAQPGTSTEQQVRGLFGAPTREQSAPGELVLIYEGEEALSGTRRAHFHLETKSRRLRRIDVFPGTVPTRDTVERMFGPGCSHSGSRKASCYEVKLSSRNEPYFHYVARGLAVFFSDGDVQSLAYLPRGRGRQARSADIAPPEVENEPEPATVPENPDGRVDSNVPGPAPVEVATVDDAPTPPQPAETSSEPETNDSPFAELRPATIAGEDTVQTGPASGTVTTGPPPLNEPKDTPQPETFRTARPDVLTLGGYYFQRADVLLTRRASDSATVAQPVFPALVDVYLDFRPQENLRTYVVGRLIYDPLDPNFSTPKTNLDKLWLYFGLFEQVFVTAGRQHVKWGSSRIWNPTDFLRAPNPDPLGVFDLRTGVDMVKVNIPFESLAANLWVVGTANLEDTPEGGLPQIRYGGAVRAEVALGTSELIATAAFLERRRPRYGLDYSLGVGVFDLNAEVALVQDSDLRLWTRGDEGFVVRPRTGFQVQASGGIAAQLRVADTYRTVLRLEGFYNQLGSDDRGLLTWLQTTGDYRPLFFGRMYGLAQLSVTARSNYEPTVSLTALGNVSDASYLGRLDLSFSKDNVAVAGFVEAPFGASGSEFRFQPDLSVAELPREDMGLFRVGLNLRLRL